MNIIHKIANYINGKPISFKDLSKHDRSLIDRAMFKYTERNV